MRQPLSLSQPDLRTKPARAAALYMERKGYPGIRPMGYIAVEDGVSFYFYYELPEGLLELEVCKTTNGTWRPAVTAFVTDPVEVRELLPL